MSSVRVLLLVSCLALVGVVSAAGVATTDPPTAGAPFYQNFQQRSGEPNEKGGEEWKMESNSIVTNMWGGVAIGNVAMNSRLMIERYIYHKDQQEEATYGWGYVLSGNQTFGGWYGATSCAWFPLQRNFLNLPSTRATLVQAHPQHKVRCLPFSNNDGQLLLKTIQHKAGLVDGHDGLPIVKRMKVEGKPCPLYLNFDKSAQTFTGAPLLNITVGNFLGRRYIVEGLTPKAALVQVMRDVDAKGWQGWFFTDNTCLADLEV